MHPEQERQAQRVEDRIQKLDEDLLSPTAKNGMKLADQISPFSFKMDSPHRLPSQFPHR